MPPVLAKPTNQQGMTAQNPPQQNRGMDEDEQPNVTPEEQALYEKFVYNAMNVIHSEETSRQILSMVQSANNPAEGVAQAAVTIAEQLYQTAQEQNTPISDEILTESADEVIEMIFELAEAAKVIPSHTEDDTFIAITRAMQLWRERHPEMVDQAQEQQDFNNISPDQMKQIIGQMGA